MAEKPEKYYSHMSKIATYESEVSKRKREARTLRVSKSEWPRESVGRMKISAR